MEFKLIYHGSLRASTRNDNRVTEKHLIRKQLHHQLKELWAVQSPFSTWKNQVVDARNSETGQDITVMEQMANQYARCGYRFLPAVWGLLTCSLDIMFLRRDHPGNLVKSGGDIDNRLKTLFDALRMPSNCGELANRPPDPGEDPFFVLLQDDSLITKVSVSTDRLLSPPISGERINDVHLVIGVSMRVRSVNRDTAFSLIEFLGD